MKKYLALTSIDLTTIDEDDIAEALAEFGCTDTIIDGAHYITCKNAKALAQMLHTLDLSGSFVEITGVYDSQEEITETTTV